MFASVEKSLAKAILEAGDSNDPSGKTSASLGVKKLKAKL